MRYLLIGEHPSFLELCKQNDSCLIDEAEDMWDAELFFMSREYDSVILADIALSPGTVKTIKKLKYTFANTSFILLQKKISTEDEINALRIGFDDFIGMPQYTEASIVNTRVEKASFVYFSSKQIRIDDLILDRETKMVYYKDKGVKMLSKAFDVLYYLALHRHRVISKMRILCALYPDPEFVGENTMEVNINNIRSALDKNFGIEFIDTVRRRGYRFCY